MDPESDDEVSWGEGNPDDAHATALTANEDYLVFATKQHIVCQSVSQSAHGEGTLQRFTIDFSRLKYHVALALSPVRRNLLAVSHGDRVLVFDLPSGSLKHVVQGTGRTVSSIAWSRRDDGLLATGTLEGRICIWHLGNLTRPLHQLRVYGARPLNLTWSGHGQDGLAFSSGGNVQVGFICQPSKRATLDLGSRETVVSVEWHPKTPGRLLAAVASGQLLVGDLSEAVAAAKGSQHGQDEDDDIFGEAEDIVTDATIGAHMSLHYPIEQASWIGNHGMLVLGSGGRVLALYDSNDSSSDVSTIWQYQLKFSGQTMVVPASGGRVLVVMADHTKSESVRLPSAVLEQIGYFEDIAVHTTQFGDSMASEEPASTAESTREHPSATMKPITMKAHRPARTSSFARTSKQFQQRRHSLSISTRRTALRRESPTEAQAPSTPSSSGITSSSEHPSLRKVDNNSPMPFLSPGVTARGPSPDVLPPIDESLHLAPVESPSVDSLTSSLAHDSDSDDETFAGNGLHGSGTLIPGGVNVPLPRPCGALFAPKGQLFTFFPPRQTPETSGDETTASEEPAAKANTRHVARAFPNFGNLISDLHAPCDYETSEDSGSEPDSPTSKMPTFSLQPSSFQSQQSWGFRTSPIKPVFSVSEAEHRVVIQVIGTSDALPPAHILAFQYRVFCVGDESGGDLCRHNARAADSVGLEHTANVWQLLAMLLDDSVPLQAMRGIGQTRDILAIAEQASLAERSDSRVNVADGPSGPFGKVRWADSPLGSSWMVLRLFEWAEQRADVQMLACMSAILVEASCAPSVDTTHAGDILLELPTHGPDYIASNEHLPREENETRPITLLSTYAAEGPLIDESPTKLQQSWHASSRNASHAPTPYLESSASTPPFSLPSLSRQGSRWSASGSASPEHHKNSFSAAAKYYAQSITDKLASYGTSPPAKKLSSSPGNELSASLPIASGSWSKTVSFASAASNTRESQLSKSFVDNDDGYDTDRTIDDSSLPHTPRSRAGGIALTLKNQGSFADDMSGNAKAPMLSESLAAKGTIWRQYYAGQLRSWGLILQATELEKVSGILSYQSTSKAPPVGVVPQPATGEARMACSICSCTIAGTQHVCLVCNHVSHLACLEDMLAAGDDDFLCRPTQPGHGS